MKIFVPGDRVRLKSALITDMLDDETGNLIGHTQEPSGSVHHVIEQDEAGGPVLLDLCCIGQYHVEPELLALVPKETPLSEHEHPDQFDYYPKRP